MRLFSILHGGQPIHLFDYDYRTKVLDEESLPLEVDRMKRPLFNRHFSEAQNYLYMKDINGKRLLFKVYGFQEATYFCDSFVFNHLETHRL